MVKDTAADAGSYTASSTKTLYLTKTRAQGSRPFQRQSFKGRGNGGKGGKGGSSEKTIRNGTNHDSARTAEKGQSTAHVS
jgi:hypothetical protein